MMNAMDGLLSGAYVNLFYVILFLLAVLIFLCMIRVIKGPRTADRIVSVNMIGTQIIITIAILSFLMGEEYLLDVSLIYAMISFLAVIVLCKVYTGVYLEHKAEREKTKKKKEKKADGDCA